MTIQHDNQSSPSSSGRERAAAVPASQENLFNYRGVDIHIAVQRTPDYVFGRADLVSGDLYFGRLSIGNPTSTPAEVHRKLAALAQARVDILNAAKGAEAFRTS